MRDHVVDRVLVEQPLVDLGGFDAVGDFVLAPFQHVPLVFFLLAQVVVAQAGAHDLERHRDRLRRHEIAVGHRLVERIGVGRHAVLEVEQRIGVVVDLVLRRRRQADEEAVEIFEDRAEALIDRAMRLVDDDEVEMAGTELRLALLLAVDQAHHRRIGREEDAALAGALGDEVDRRGIRQMRLEGAGRLVHQRHAVGEEQHALDPAGAHQEIDQRDHGAGLAGAGRHDQQRLALAVLLEAPRDIAGWRGAGRGARRSCG